MADRGRLYRIDTWRRALSVACTPSWRTRDNTDIAHIRLLIATQLTGERLGVDVGANKGHFLAAMEQTAPATSHIAFEPIPALADNLRSQHPTADVRSLALAAEASDNVDFAYFPTASAYSGFVGGTHEPAGTDASIISVPVSTLDTELADTEPAFIKIDVEGAERQVIEGAAGTLARCRPMTVFEHGPESPDDSAAIHDVLSRADLAVLDIDGGGPYDQTSFVARVSLGGVWNFVAVPIP